MQPKKIITSREIGAAIKKRREELGRSQEWLAEFLGVSYQSVQRYENGNIMLNVEKVQIIADALSVPVTSFFTREDHPQIAAEPATSYASSEEKTLLKYFRDIPGKSDKQLVVHVARLAARK
jgi:transcriptional regulator with XRE-family HTH domain